jgi:hypothetical protein
MRAKEHYIIINSIYATVGATTTQTNNEVNDVMLQADFVESPYGGVDTSTLENYQAYGKRRFGFVGRCGDINVKNKIYKYVLKNTDFYFAFTDFKG